MTLFDLTAAWRELYEMASDPDVPEDVLRDTLEGIEGEIEIKADGYATVMRKLEGDEEYIDKEIKRLQDRKATIRANRDRMKQSLEDAMRLTGKTKFKTTLFSFGIQKNGGKQPLVIDDPATVPEEYKRMIMEIDKEKIRAALDNGATLEFAYLAERGESLRIR